MPRSSASQLKREVDVDEITLDGKRIRVRNVEFAVDDLRLDPSNPRIANTFAIQFRGGAADVQEELEARLWSDPDVRDLYRQVSANRGLIERVIVRDDGVVVEGNCRTVVYRKLREKYPKDPLWATVPARVLPEDIPERDVAMLLGEMHVTGKNAWSPFEKAGHVYRLHKDLGLTQDEISTRLRLSKSKVNQLIRAFQAMKERFLLRYPGREGIRKFSYFEELFKKPELRDWAANPRNLDTFVRLVGEEKLSHGAQVRELPSIIENREALNALLDGGHFAAKKILEAENPALTSPLFRQMVEMADALGNARLDDILRVQRSGGTAAHQILQRLTEALDRFRELCRIDERSPGGPEPASRRRRLT